MARTHGRIKIEVWDSSSELRALDPVTQWTYFMLFSQPQINNCGVLPLVPRKWAKYASGLNEDAVLDAIAELERHGFIVVDHDTDELLVRTFVKHDAIRKQPNLEKSAVRQYQEIESGRIREALSREHPDLFGEAPIPGQTELLKDLPKGVPKDLHEGGSGERGSERGSRTPPRPRARTRTAPTPSPTTGPPRRAAAGETPRAPTPATAAADLATALDQLGFDKTQIRKATADPDRAGAWLAKAKLEAETNPGGYVWRGIAGGQWPTLNGVEPSKARTVEDWIRDVGWMFQPDDLHDELEHRCPDEDDRLEFADLAADLRREHLSA